MVRSSRRAFDLSEQQLKAGTINLVTLIQTEETLFTAEDQLAVDRFNHMLAVVSLFQALGGGWPPGPARRRAAAPRPVRGLLGAAGLLRDPFRSHASHSRSRSKTLQLFGIMPDPSATASGSCGRRGSASPARRQRLTPRAGRRPRATPGRPAARPASAAFRARVPPRSARATSSAAAVRSEAAR